MMEREPEDPRQVRSPHFQRDFGKSLAPVFDRSGADCDGGGWRGFRKAGGEL